MTHRDPCRFVRRGGWISAFVLVTLLLAARVYAHEMFLVAPAYFLDEATDASVSLHNGTFAYSENAVRPGRFSDATIVDGAGIPTRQTGQQWHVDGKSSVLDFQTGAFGTYVIGVSTEARKIKMGGKKFAGYLADAGLFEALEKRKASGDIDDAARERYAKHAKAIVQVGDTPTDAYQHRFGYPLEIVPLSNPTTLTAGDTLDFLVLSEGEPLVDYPIYASYGAYSEEHEASTETVETASDTPTPAARAEAFAGRTGQDGIVRVELTSPGRWYVRIIELLEVDEWGLDYRSNWATLTFEIR